MATSSPSTKLALFHLTSPCKEAVPYTSQGLEYLHYPGHLTHLTHLAHQAHLIHHAHLTSLVNPLAHHAHLVDPLAQGPTEGGGPPGPQQLLQEAKGEPGGSASARS